MTRRAPLALACLLLLAGCGGVTDQSPAAEATPAGTEVGVETAEPTTSPTEAAAGPGVEVRGDLPVDAGRAFGRVLALTGTDVAPRPVVARNRSEWRRLRGREPTPLDRALGFESRRVDTGSPVGYTPREGPVSIAPGNGSSEQVERVLVHEFVHVVQFESGMLPRAGSARTATTDRRKTWLALREGGAVYVTDVYAHRYLDVRNDSAVVAARRERSPTARSALAPYYVGHRYVAARIDDPAALPTVYADPPRTTEQLVHGYSRAEEPPRALTVTARTGASGWVRTGTDTAGELTTRNALTTALSPSRAATAAAGWGTDRLLAFEGTDSNRGWVWVHRWDSPGEADEARAAFAVWADRRSSSPSAYRVARVGPATTAVAFGDRSLVANVTVTGGNGNVTVGTRE